MLYYNVLYHVALCHVNDVDMHNSQDHQLEAAVPRRAGGLAVARRRDRGGGLKLTCLYLLFVCCFTYS